MQCEQCKWFSIGVNDHYGSCKRYPKNENKNKTDYCGEFTEVIITKAQFIHQAMVGEVGVGIKFVEPTEFEEVKPKRGRKPKNVD